MEKPVNDPLVQEQFLETCLVSIKKSTADKELNEILLTSLDEDFDKTFNM